MNAAVNRRKTEKPAIIFQGSPPSTSQDGGEAKFERGFDIYATPFVPEKIKNINSLPGQEFTTPLAKSIDLHAYGLENLGSRLLPPIALASASYSYEACLKDPPTLSPLNYESFFRFHLDSEIQQQQRENASYALYVHQVTVEFKRDGNAKITVRVPGLRENSPYVEEDDTVQLRQLRFDHLGRLMERTAPLSSYPMNVYYQQYFSGPWTEIIYNARVKAVVRSLEQLVLNVAGLTPESSEYDNLKFNIQFPLPLNRYSTMQSALSQVQASLLRARQITNEAGIMGKASTNPASLSNPFWVQSMLFPTEADCKVQANVQSGTYKHELYDRVLNLEQRIAVENACGQTYGVLPYLISGPPGTGKTKTIIEIALQLVNNVASVSHILLCAPSEQAADTLANRLRSYMKPAEMLRLNRPTRTFSEVPDTILQYCYTTETRFDLPPFEQLMSYKIVVTSCRDAHMLLQARMTNTDLYTVESGLRTRIHPSDPPQTSARLHWDALLVDEAAQATEPETLLPLLVVAPPPDAPQLTFAPLLIMAGDEHQLTPRTSLPSTPLQRSLFARLFSRPVYANHPLARHFRSHAGLPSTAPLTISPSMVPVLRPPFTNLIRNYRSHPAVLTMPSRLFYASTLVAEAPITSTFRLFNWLGWPRKPTSPSDYYPLIFHDNLSPDDLESDGGGWFNPGEAEIACSYAKSLVSSGLVSEAEIAIMSPFKAQVRRIRGLIRSEKYRLWGVNVGPTEAYQGLEYGVVILCVTRSRGRFVGRDRELGWGIVGEEMGNRLNVALTRAKMGLIMVGKRELVCVKDIQDTPE
ncbi:P-loop containing nucleoside triphosphate hydrolase protein [Immersiella caudata]|uniref:P-loop containing nucleoside triphosphate hydrolase protein n=1 Tax=Immersiella caudata TaxID=314043 RepID=A0AA39WWI4_9PEZI|nr:P-loop containing nucleoside triphosphate hydrolase protein [Immersiella caudata]